MFDMDVGRRRFGQDAFLVQPGKCVGNEGLEQ
jgi:hypothetical protein